VIDAKNNTVVATIPLGGKPEFSADDGKGKIYVNVEDTAELVEIDGAKAVVTKRFKLTGCEDPTGLAMDTKKRRVFSACANKVMAVSDPDAGKVIATVPIGARTDGAAFDPGKALAFSSNGDGTMTVIKESGGKYEVVENAKTATGARTVAVDPATHRLYLPTAEFKPPAAGGNQRPAMVPDNFKIIVVAE